MPSHVFGSRTLRSRGLQIPDLPQRGLGRSTIRNGTVAERSPDREDPLPVLPATDTTCAIEHASCEFELLREYRSLLVMDVVAGKIGVGGPARRLPDDADVRVREAMDPDPVVN